MNKITVKKIVEDYNFKILAGSKYLNNEITVTMIERPIIELSGNLSFFDNKRISVIGVKEYNILKKQSKTEREKNVENFLSKKPPVIFFSGNDLVSNIFDIFIKYADKYQVPLVQSNLKTTPLIGSLYYYLQKELAGVFSQHGVLLDINGIGTLITGDSGVGKSETALDLIKRGYSLIADDLVEIKEPTVGTLIGTAPDVLKRHLEVRGIGVIDVINIFGSGAFRKSKKIHLIVNLEQWEKGKTYDRLGDEEEYQTYFNTKIPKVIIPVKPGRSLATLVETAAMNQKLKKLGINSAKDFVNKVNQKVKEREEIYYEEE